jgi:hypothetical protein
MLGVEPGPIQALPRGATTMMPTARRTSRFRQILSAVFTMTAFGLAQANAGECPADKVLKEPRKLEDVDEKLLKRETLAIVPLKGWRGVGDLLLRTRRLTIGPGGQVPIHYHNDRPSIVYVVKGELVEYSSHCSVPIVHKVGEASAESGDFHGHWWENRSGAEAVVISSDVIPPDQQDAPAPM